MNRYLGFRERTTLRVLNAVKQTFLHHDYQLYSNFRCNDRKNCNHSFSVIVQIQTDDFKPDFELLAEAITEKTKAVIINSPNNPTGTCYTKETIQELADLLNKKTSRI